MEAVRGQTPYSDRTQLNVQSIPQCQSVRSPYDVWPLTASMEVKNKYAYIITQDICNNFIEVIFFVECMVWRPNRLLQHLTAMSLIDKIEAP